MEDRLIFRYEGLLADQGQLNFYELGRSYYAAARMVYTVARFRETGRVLQKIQERIDSTIVATAPRRGSFEFEAVAFVKDVVIPAAVSVPLTAIFAWVWQRIVRSDQVQRAIDNDAKIELRKIESRERIALSREETRRIQTLRDFVNGRRTSIEDYLRYQREGIEQLTLRGGSRDELKEATERVARLTADKERQDIINAHETVFSKISSAQGDALEKRVRQIAPDLGLPLRSSAETFSFGMNDQKNLFARLDRSEFERVDAEVVSDSIETIQAEIIRYDKEGRYGKLRTYADGTVYGTNEFFFRTSSSCPKRAHSDIIDAMHHGIVIVSLTSVLDAQGNVARVILQDISL